MLPGTFVSRREVFISVTDIMNLKSPTDNHGYYCIDFSTEYTEIWRKFYGKPKAAVHSLWINDFSLSFVGSYNSKIRQENILLFSIMSCLTQMDS